MIQLNRLIIKALALLLVLFDVSAPIAAQAQTETPGERAARERAQAAREAQRIEVIFARLQAAKTDGNWSVQKLYEQLWNRQEEALPYLMQQAKGGNLLAQAMVGRMTQPQVYRGYEQALSSYSKRFDDVEDKEERAERLAAQAQVPQQGGMRGDLTMPKGISHLPPSLSWSRVRQMKRPLAGLDRKEAVPFLVEKVGWTARTGPEQQLAMISLGLLRDPRGFEPLAEVVRSGQQGLTIYALYALPLIDDKRALPLLAQVVQEDDLDPRRGGFGTDGYGYTAGLRAFAAQMLAEVGDASVLPTLEQVAREDQFSSVRAAAKSAVETIQQREQRARR